MGSFNNQLLLLKMRSLHEFHDLLFRDEKIFYFLIPKIDPSAKLSEYSTKQKRWDKLLEFGGRGTTTWEDEMDMLIEAAGRRETENAPRLF